MTEAAKKDLAKNVGAQSLEGFLQHLMRRYKTIPRAWRLVLDKSGDGALSETNPRNPRHSDRCEGRRVYQSAKQFCQNSFSRELPLAQPLLQTLFGVQAVPETSFPEPISTVLPSPSCYCRVSEVFRHISKRVRIKRAM